MQQLFNIGDRVKCIQGSIRKDYLIRGCVYYITATKTREHNGVRDLEQIVQVDSLVDWWKSSRFTRKLSNEERIKEREAQVCLR
jgi:hypothetical protein